MTSATQTQQGAPKINPQFRARADIQGLRALAVVAVICQHVFGWPTGGFAGVDVFFVISGFLITGLILRDYSRSGRFPAAAFYGRRIRRIVPAAAVTLIATAVAGYFLFNSARASATVWDSVSAFFFASNWRFQAVGTDYFQSLEAVSPVQHFWSLSIEEQFYLVWPWLLVGVLILSARIWRTPRRARIGGAIALTVIVAASLGYSVWESSANPTLGYFSTFSRAWELGLGGLLAVAAPLVNRTLLRVPAAVRAMAGWVGLAGIVASLVLITESLPFPGPWALAPVLATALVIAAGIPSAPQTLFPLTNPVSVYIGNLSYSLYLWHFPVLVFITLLLPDRTAQVTWMIVGLTVAVSVVSYYLIEQPFHRSPWLESPRLPAAERRQAWQIWRAKFSMKFILAFLGVVVMTTAVYVVVQSPLQQQASARPTPGAGSGVDEGVPGDDPLIELQADLAAAASADEWPTNLSPSLDQVIRASSSSNPANACFQPGQTPAFDSCTWGSDQAPRHMYLVGDSTALSYAPAFRAIAEASSGQWKITTIGLYGCRFTNFQVKNDGAGVMDSCTTRKSDIANQVAADGPDVVVVANAFALGQTPDGTPLSVAEITDSTVVEMSRYSTAGAIVYLAPPPLGVDLGQCYSQVSSPKYCNATVGATWHDFAAATEATKGERAVFISSLPFTCVAEVCPAFAGAQPTRYDTVHMTTAYAERISPVIRTALVAQGVM